MYICPMYSKELLKGTLKTVVLNLLRENNRLYGYEITQKVKELTGNKIQITEGALYPLLHKLEADGLVTIEKVHLGKRVRKYYRLTPEGTNNAQKLVDELLDFMVTMKHVLTTQDVKNYEAS